MCPWLVSGEGLGFADVSPLGFTARSLLKSYWRPNEAPEPGRTAALFICWPVFTFPDEDRGTQSKPFIFSSFADFS